MRAIHLARLDKVRPVLVLTREPVRATRGRVTVAPLTSHRRGLVSEVPLGVANGLDSDSVANIDDTVTIDVDDLGPWIGSLQEHQEPMLAAAVFAAFDLRW